MAKDRYMVLTRFDGHTPGDVIELTPSEVSALAPGTVDMRPVRTPLPERLPADLPGRPALEAAGITTVKQLQATKDEYILLNVRGVGKATLRKIRKALEERD